MKLKWGKFMKLSKLFSDLKPFAITWLFKSRPHKIPKQYQVIVFDIFGKESQIDGLRTEFKNHDVAWSFMKSYKKSYPLHSFAMVTKQKNSPKKIIFKYI